MKPREGRKSELKSPARLFSNQLMMETVSMPQDPADEGREDMEQSLC